MTIREKIAKFRCYSCESFGKAGCSKGEFPCDKASDYANGVLNLLKENKPPVLTKKELQVINNSMPPEAKYGDVFEKIAKAQRDAGVRFYLED